MSQNGLLLRVRQNRVTGKRSSEETLSILIALHFVGTANAVLREEQSAQRDLGGTEIVSAKAGTHFAGS
jgi:hypothetical protein